jgi:hypothetical protein
MIKKKKKKRKKKEKKKTGVKLLPPLKNKNQDTSFSLSHFRITLEKGAEMR